MSILNSTPVLRLFTLTKADSNFTVAVGTNTNILKRLQTCSKPPKKVEKYSNNNNNNNNKNNNSNNNNNNNNNNKNFYSAAKLLHLLYILFSNSLNLHLNKLTNTWLSK